MFAMWIRPIVASMQWKHVHDDHVQVEQRTYKGHIDTPKTARGKRQVAKLRPRRTTGQISFWAADKDWPYDHHLRFWDPRTMRMAGETDKLPEHMMWYVLRHSDATTIL
jgi:hypothetical protein